MPCLAGTAKSCLGAACLLPQRITDLAIQLTPTAQAEGKRQDWHCSTTSVLSGPWICKGLLRWYVACSRSERQSRVVELSSASGPEDHGSKRKGQLCSPNFLLSFSQLQLTFPCDASIVRSG